MRNKFIMVFGCVLLAGMINPATAQNERALAREGNEAYNQGTYDESEVQYRKALEVNDDFLEARFNLGNSLVKQERYKQAIEAYKQVLSNTDDESVKAKAYHNMGNAHLENKKLKKSIKAYKNALRHNPNDPLTQYNLSYALKKQQKRQQQKQQNKNQQNQNKQNQNKQDQNKQDQQKQNQNKNKNQQGQNQQKQQNKDQQQQQKQNQQQKDQQQANKDQQQQQSGEKDKEQGKREKGKQQPKPKKGELTKKEAERLFRALKDQERKTQRKLLKKRKDGKPQDVEKDW